MGEGVVSHHVPPVDSWPIPAYGPSADGRQTDPVEDTISTALDQMAPTDGLSAVLTTTREYLPRNQHAHHGKYRANASHIMKSTAWRRQLPGLGAALLYGACSTSMAFMNKSILNTYSFDYPFAIMVFQMLFTIAVLRLLKTLGRVSYPPVTWERSRSFLLPSMCYALNAVLGLYALGRMNIPMYGVLKRCTPVVSLILACFMLKKGPPSTLLIVSVLMMTVGCVVAGSADLTFEVSAYLCGAGSNVTQALYLTLVQIYSEKRSTVETLHLNSVNTLPLLLAMCVLKGEPFSLVFHPHVFTLQFTILLVMVTGLGCLLNYSMFLCTAMNCALTTTVVGMLKTIVQTTLGFFTFGGVSVNATLLSGVVTNLSGGLLYAFAKYTDSNNSKNLPSTVKDVQGESGSKDRVKSNRLPMTLGGVYYQSRERHVSESQDDLDEHTKASSYHHELKSIGTGGRSMVL